ncbi:MAG: hypothetical protein WCT11_00910 [Candidatus Magasanikbacteria bacterium]
MPFDTLDPHEQEAIAGEVTKKITALMQPGVPLQTVAELLIAQKFLKYEKVLHQSPVLQFDVKGFVEELKREKQLEKFNKINLPEATSVHQTGSIILPPDSGEIITGSGEGIETKKIIPRTQYLMEILSEMGLKYEIYDGQNTPDMMRSLSYKAFVVEDIHKMVLVCNEEGNATFVVHKLNEGEKDDWGNYTVLTKDQLKELKKEKISQINFDCTSEEWKEKIKIYLTDSHLIDIPPIDKPTPTDTTPRTPEQALQILKEAMEKWKVGSQKTRGKFNLTWLKTNGYGYLYQWIYKHDGIKKFILESQNTDLITNFDYTEDWTWETATATLILAYHYWKNHPETHKNGFNVAWLKKNGYSGLNRHIRLHGGIKKYVNGCGYAPLVTDFIYEEQHENYTEKTAYEKLNQAFEEWKNGPLKKGKRFNMKWLIKNHYKGLYSWITENTTPQIFIEKCGNEEIKNIFEYREKHKEYTIEKAIDIISDIFNQWKNQQEDTPSDFNTTWFRQHGGEGLYKSIRRKGLQKQISDSFENPLIKELFKT